MVMKELKSFHSRFINNFKIASNYVTINLLINSISITFLSIMLKTKCLALKAGLFWKVWKINKFISRKKLKKINEWTLSKWNSKTCKTNEKVSRKWIQKKVFNISYFSFSKQLWNKSFTAALSRIVSEVTTKNIYSTYNWKSAT